MPNDERILETMPTGTLGLVATCLLYTSHPVPTTCFCNNRICNASIIYMETIVIYYGSITDTVITETSGGDRMGTTKIRTDEE